MDLRGVRRPVRALGAAALLVPLVSTGCATVVPPVPGCDSVSRMTVVAQSVPSAAYVPCVVDLPTGWQVTRFEPERGGTTFSLLSDRAGGRAVDVELVPDCVVAGATPEPPRTAGGRTYLRLRSLSPRYAGTLYDVFPGGCVRYHFDFARGVHIGLMEDLFATVDLLPRRELRLDVRRDLGEELDP